MSFTKTELIKVRERGIRKFKNKMKRVEEENLKKLPKLKQLTLINGSVIKCLSTGLRIRGFTNEVKNASL